jgi:hypothetical protein
VDSLKDREFRPRQGEVRGPSLRILLLWHVAKRALDFEMGGAHHLAPFADLIGDLLGCADGDEQGVLTRLHGVAKRLANVAGGEAVIYLPLF